MPRSPVAVHSGSDVDERSIRPKQRSARRVGRILEQEPPQRLRQRHRGGTRATLPEGNLRVAGTSPGPDDRRAGSSRASVHSIWYRDVVQEVQLTDPGDQPGHLVVRGDADAAEGVTPGLVGSV